MDSDSASRTGQMAHSDQCGGLVDLSYRQAIPKQAYRGTNVLVIQILTAQTRRKILAYKLPTHRMQAPLTLPHTYLGFLVSETANLSLQDQSEIVAGIS